MIRVALVLPTLEVGGQERLVADLARRLPHFNVEPVVVALAGTGPIAAELKQAGVASAVLPPRRHLPGYPAALLAWLRQEKVQVLHSQSGSWFPTAVAARLKGIPAMHTEHGRYPDEPRLARLADRIAWACTRRLVVVSHLLQEEMRERLGLRQPPEVIANGVELPALLDPGERAALRAQLGLSADAPVIGTVGRLVPVKDHVLLLRATAAVSQHFPALRCVIVGDGPLRDILQLSAQQLGVADRVLFLGHRDDARRLVGTFDVYVSSSQTEGTPIALLEGMAAGCAIVATNVGGIPHVLEGAAGRMVPPREPAALAAAIEAVLDDPAERARLAARARERVVGHFSLDACARRYAEIYAELVGARRQGAA